MTEPGLLNLDCDPSLVVEGRFWNSKEDVYNATSSIPLIWCHLTKQVMTWTQPQVSPAHSGERRTFHQNSLMDGSFQSPVNANMCKSPTAETSLITVWGFPLPVQCVQNILTMTVKSVRSGLEGTIKRSLIPFPVKS